MQEEPGKNGASVRLTISGKLEDEARLNKLKHKLEADSGARLTVSRVFWLAIERACQAEGL